MNRVRNNFLILGVLMMALALSLSNGLALEENTKWAGARVTGDAGTPFSSVNVFSNPPPFAEDYAVPYPEARRRDFEAKPFSVSHESLREIDLDDKLQEGPSEKVTPEHITLNSGNSSSTVGERNDTAHNSTNDKQPIDQNGHGNNSSSGTVNIFDILIKNSVTRLVLKEIRNISSVYRNYFYRFYNKTISGFENRFINDEPSNIIQLVDEALSLNDTVEVPGCRVTPVSVYICTIRVYHVGTLPRNIVSNYNEKTLKDLICPCPKPVPGFLCPMYANSLILDRYEENCRN